MVNFFTKTIFVILLFGGAHFAANAQNNCNFAEKTSPLLLNLQIGMSPAQTQAVFGRDLKVKIKKKGERVFFQNFIKKPAPNSLNGVRALYLRFFDGKLYQIEVFYEPRTDLKTLENITAALSAHLNFSASQWQIKNNRANAKCGELSLTADNVLNPHLELTDENVRSIIETEREKKSGRK